MLNKFCGILLSYRRNQWAGRDTLSGATSSSIKANRVGSVFYLRRPNFKTFRFFFVYSKFYLVFFFLPLLVCGRSENVRSHPYATLVAGLRMEDDGSFLPAPCPSIHQRWGKSARLMRRPTVTFHSMRACTSNLLPSCCDGISASPSSLARVNLLLSWLTQPTSANKSQVLSLSSYCDRGSCVYARPLDTGFKGFPVDLSLKKRKLLSREEISWAYNPWRLPDRNPIGSPPLFRQDDGSW